MVIVCSLPDFRSKEINENFEIIAKKTEEILKVTNEVNVKITIKSIADKVKTFIVSDIAGDQQTAEIDESSSTKEVSEEDKEQEMIKLAKSATETEDSMKIESNIQKKGKRMLESVEPELDVEKKLKYESPLDFLRVPNNKYE